MNLTCEQREMIELNTGKKVNVRLLSGDVKELIIHNGVHIMGAFRYVMHTAKRPRKEFYFLEGEYTRIMHVNMDAGYYLVDPMRIVL